MSTNPLSNPQKDQFGNLINPNLNSNQGGFDPSSYLNQLASQGVNPQTMYNPSTQNPLSHIPNLNNPSQLPNALNAQNSQMEKPRMRIPFLENKAIQAKLKKKKEVKKGNLCN